MISVLRAAVVAAALLCAPLLPCTGAIAQEKSAIKDGFVFPPGSAKVLLFRPSIKVGSQSAGGSITPNADWTDASKANIGAALSKAQAALGRQIITADEPIGPAAATLADYRALFSTVADAVVTYQFFVGNRLPTKKRKGAPFEWSLGSDVRQVPGADQADYILFLETEDYFGSTGRKMAQMFAAMASVGVSSGLHKGYAGLVDARTGDLVWLNADRQMGGDVREADGAAKRVSQLLQGFPGTGNPPPANAPATSTPGAQ